MFYEFFKKQETQLQINKIGQKFEISTKFAGISNDTLIKRLTKAHSVIDKLKVELRQKEKDFYNLKKVNEEIKIKFNDYKEKIEVTGIFKTVDLDGRFSNSTAIE